MEYKKINWKYVLTEPYRQNVEIFGQYLFIPGYISLFKDGTIILNQHYAWDGPSGPTIDTKTFMRGSLVHDALYQLMREGKLSRKFRKRADKLLKEICLKDGMNPIRAQYIYWTIRLFGGRYAKRKENGPR
jgi:ribonucleotide reductase alpha subunit